MNEKNDATEAPQDISQINKYEQVVIAARESRRLNEAVRSSNKELKRRVTDVAWERLMGGKINFTYGDVPIVEEDFEFPELKEDGEEAASLAPDLIPSPPTAPADPEPEAPVADEDADEDEDDDDGDGNADFTDEDFDDDIDVDDEDLDDDDEDDR